MEHGIDYSRPIIPPQKPRGSKARRALVAAALITVGAAGGVAGYPHAKAALEQSQAPKTQESGSPSKPEGTAAPAETTTTIDPGRREKCIAALSLETRVGQVIMPAVKGEDLATFSQIAKKYQIGGAVVITQPPDLNSIKAFKQSTVVPMMIATDEEGGVVQRFKGVEPLPSAADSTKRPPEEIERSIAGHSKKLHDIGIDVAFAPVLDVRAAQGNSFIGNRAFSDNPAIVTAYGAATVRGWKAGGITPVVKHWPGHGGAQVDTHLDVATTQPYDQLLQRDLLPYKSPEIHDQKPAVMIGHLIVPGLADTPASINPRAVQTLRNDLGYKDNLVFSDSLGMGAIGVLGFDAGDAAVMTLRAGTDVAAYALTEVKTVSEGEVADMAETITRAVNNGVVPQEQLNTSVRRIMDAKGYDPCRS